MPFAIIRCQKCSLGQVAAAEKHNLRKSENHSNPDIDTSKSHLNKSLISCSSISREVARQVEEIQKTQKRKIRKDAPRALEYVVTASPEAFEKIDAKAYFEASLRFLQARHGTDRIVSAVVHLDESTPHMHVIAVPVYEGKLNAKQFMARNALKTLQDDFGRLGAGFGLQRGREGSQATHMRVSDFKKDADKQIEAIAERVEKLREEALGPRIQVKQPDPKLMQSKKAYGLECINSTIKQISPQWEAMHAKAAENEALRAENSSLQEENRSLKTQVSRLQDYGKTQRERAEKAEANLAHASFFVRFVDWLRTKSPEVDRLLARFEREEKQQTRPDQHRGRSR